MTVDPGRPFNLIYSLYQHEYLGFLFESYVVQLNESGKLTYSNQNISSKNAMEFDKELDENDYELIRTIDSMQQDVILSHFSKKKLKPQEFFLKTYDKKTGDKLLQGEIDQYLEKRRTFIMPLLVGKKVYEMGSDGEPAWKKIDVIDEKATILFHFRKNDDNTHYFPTIKLFGDKIEFRDSESYVIASEPAWMMVDRKLFTFEKPINGGKLKPFLKKKFILIPKNVEDTYYEKFVAPLVESFDVYAKGFDILTERHTPTPILTLSEVKQTNKIAASLFDKEESTEVSSKVLVELSYRYGQHKFKADHLKDVSVNLKKNGQGYTFHRIQRNPGTERELLQDLVERGLKLRNSRVTLSESEAFDWLNDHQKSLTSRGFEINQQSNGGKRYFLGTSSIDIQIEEKIDWFDIKAVVRFGEFEIPFSKIRKLIIQNKTEITLPNGEIGVIPASWAESYEDLFHFSEETEERTTLKKHHLALVQSLSSKEGASISISKKLQRLSHFDEIEDSPLPVKFKGELRPYQKAGYNWIQFLNEFQFGGCLADDMGLGKTVQTLVAMQASAERGEGSTLLIMPTSLIYNWQMEAKRFTPSMKVLNYTGVNREKNPERFSKYDLVITSYGIVRLDAEILAQYYFNYIVLDESQAIKNPESIISKAVRKLKSRRRLVLTGTPIENSTLDLWSQLSFINPGLLGSLSYFQKQFQIPIEKKKDATKTRKLHSLIKPFILRRDKSQVAQDLPEKSIAVKYCTMSEEQREFYEKEKESFRNKILDEIETAGLNKSQMILLQGLTRLRQIANHPKMVDPEFDGSSGKLEDITYMIDTALQSDHNILIFSQFVKHLKIISDHLDSKKIDYAYLDGSVRDRQAEVEKFQKNKKIHIFLISLKAGGLGLNLTKADYVFLLDPWWNPAVEAQAIDRAHRIGQKNKVFTYKFISKDTLEEKILVLQESKLKLAKELVTVEESFVKSLTKEDIRKLFS